jgi:hypothetical protein
MLSLDLRLTKASLEGIKQYPVQLLRSFVEVVILVPLTKNWGLNLSREKFNGVVGRSAPHNTTLKHKPKTETILNSFSDPIPDT